MRLAFWGILIFSFSFSFSQNLASNVYIFNLEALPNGMRVVHSPKLLTQFNSKGYNNQPFFINDHELLLTVKINGTSQTDIYKFNLNTNTRQQITKTSLSEFSPSVTSDMKSLSFVRVDDEASALQRIYTAEYKLNSKINSPLPDIKNVGYYSWLDSKNVALFLVNKPSQIALVNTDTKDPLIFSSDIGRCMQSNTNGNLLYVHKITDEYWYIKEYDSINQKANIVSETVKGSEDFAHLPDGEFIMAKDSKLYSIHPQTEKSWTEIADLSFFGIRNITRLAFNGGKLALVDQSK